VTAANMMRNGVRMVCKIVPEGVEVKRVAGSKRAVEAQVKGGSRRRPGVLPKQFGW
jgi:hypothetical protein